jgi:hypothetical protein
MGNPGSNHSSLDSLRKTLHSLKEIRSALLPFLRLLKDDVGQHRRHRTNHHTPSATASKGKRSHAGNSASDEVESQSTSQFNPHRRTEAEAAVALAVCTLRYMGGRLRGLDVGRKKDDPLRMELNKIRAVLVSLQKLESSDAVDARRDGGDGDAGKDSKQKDDENNKQLSAAVSSEKRKMENEASIEVGSEKASSSNKKQRR